MQHIRVSAAGAEFHVARLGSGPPLLLLHGWPEFWLTWEPVMLRLANRFTLFAPDLRGFGDSDKPAGPWGAPDHAQDVVALLNALGLPHVGVLGHDVGGAVMQALARPAWRAVHRSGPGDASGGRAFRAPGGAGSCRCRNRPVLFRAIVAW